MQKNQCFDLRLKYNYGFDDFISTYFDDKTTSIQAQNKLPENRLTNIHTTHYEPLTPHSAITHTYPTDLQPIFYYLYKKKTQFLSSKQNRAGKNTSLTNRPSAHCLDTAVRTSRHCLLLLVQLLITVI